MVTNKFYTTEYEAVVVGAGHAGCEAALALARTGIKTVMLRCGAMGAAMSGSGPAVFGIFRTGEEAAPALESLRKWYVRSFAAQPVSWLDNL